MIYILYFSHIFGKMYVYVHEEDNETNDDLMLLELFVVGELKVSDTVKTNEA